MIWLELLCFVPFTLLHYFGPFRAEWRRLSATKLGQQTLWSGEMLNGVGACVLMYMLADALWEGSVGHLEVEILFLSHALWIGVITSFLPPWPIRKFAYLHSPHTYLTIGVYSTGWGLVRPVCLLCCAAILAFGCYRRIVQLPRDVYLTAGPLSWAAFREALKEVHTEGHPLPQWVFDVDNALGNPEVVSAAVDSRKDLV